MNLRKSNTPFHRATKKFLPIVMIGLAVTVKPPWSLVWFIMAFVYIWANELDEIS